jgi:hypothetical protein
LLAAVPSVAQPSGSYGRNCSAALSQRWNEQVATRPIDGQEHVIRVQVSLPADGANKSLSRIESALQRAFPSIQLEPSVLVGCCQLPIIGSISFEDFERLKARRFAPLCELGQRFSSELVAVRISHREAYLQGEEAQYFFVAWSPRDAPNV